MLCAGRVLLLAAPLAVLMKRGTHSFVLRATPPFAGLCHELLARHRALLAVTVGCVVIPPHISMAQLGYRDIIIVTP